MAVEEEISQQEASDESEKEEEVARNKGGRKDLRNKNKEETRRAEKARKERQNWLAWWPFWLADGLSGPLAKKRLLCMGSLWEICGNNMEPRLCRSTSLSSLEQNKETYPTEQLCICIRYP